MPHASPAVPGQWLSTSTVAAASGYSVQQVRDLERLGVIPPAARAANGYRQFSPKHLPALRAYRNLAAAVGPVPARQTLAEARILPLDQAVALINSLHVSLAREREDALAALRALDLIAAESHGQAATVEADPMTITELAGALGVRPSTLRFWEQAGLVNPERVTTLNARRYPSAAIREARITAALRAAGYRIPDVQHAIQSIRRIDDLDTSRAALRTRLDAIARRMLALLTAGTEITELITAA
ncbi:MerR family transcriptional regulator [Arthrobacter castelli]|uniref:MerR family transcriptional regulator n=1 Tax=Arthrobacter castelli TaxID=271431 RepID=UPI000401B320|nr:MerR family transcriptional regulator [Arthrobacter castelli]